MSLLKINRLAGVTLMSILLFSCKSFDFHSKKDVSLKSWKASFFYKDLAGTYSYKRWSRVLKDRVATKIEIYDPKTQNLLEKSITISMLSESGSLIPYQSQYEVWLDGEKNISKSKLIQNKELTFQITSDDKKLSGQKTFPKAPKRKYCYFSQIPECLVAWKIWKSFKQNDDFYFYVIWDAYPFHYYQYNNISNLAITEGKLNISNLKPGQIQFSLETNNQILFYQYDKDFQFEKLTWVAQAMELKRNN